MNEYQFEKTNLPPLSAANIAKVLTKRFRKKDENDPSSELEEIIQLLFPNGEIEELLATEDNLKESLAENQNQEFKKKHLRVLFYFLLVD